MPMSTTITCLLKVLGSESLKHKELYEMVVDNIEAKGQCPVPDEEALANSEISLDDESLPFVLHRISSLVSTDPQFFEKVSPYEWLETDLYYLFLATEENSIMILVSCIHEVFAQISSLLNPGSVYSYFPVH